MKCQKSSECRWTLGDPDFSARARAVVVFPEPGGPVRISISPACFITSISIIRCRESPRPGSNTRLNQADVLVCPGGLTPSKVRHLFVWKWRLGPRHSLPRWLGLYDLAGFVSGLQLRRGNAVRAGSRGAGPACPQAPRRAS